MTEFLYSLDTTCFFFINHTLSNPFLDWLMPLLTDLNKKWPAVIVAAVLWAWLMIRGGRVGRVTGLLLVLAVALSDQLSSTVLKNLICRMRPCHVLHGVRLLVDCGDGYSFPSSHAVNNFAAATVLTKYYRKYMWGWISLASLIALTRPYVGVHYPSDIIGGALLGYVCASAVIILWEFIDAKYLHDTTRERA